MTVENFIRTNPEPHCTGAIIYGKGYDDVPRLAGMLDDIPYKYLQYEVESWEVALVKGDIVVGLFIKKGTGRA